MKANFSMEPLTCENFDETINVAFRVFPYDSPEELQFHFLLPLVPRNEWCYLETYKDNQKWVDELSGVSCYSLRYIKENKIAGVTGLYSYIDRPQEAWLGWFGIDPGFRRKGLGKRMLRWTIDEARNHGFKTLRIWTTNSPDTDAARMLYKKNKFRSKLLPVKIEDYSPVIYSLSLNGGKPLPFNGDIILASASRSVCHYIARQAERRSRKKQFPAPVFG